MSGITINFDHDALREATIQAISGVLTPEMKAQLIEKAVRSILTPSDESWNRGQSPIQRVFTEAVEEIARQEAMKIVSEDASIRERLNVLLRTTADRLFGMDAEKFSEKISSAVAASMRDSRY